MNGVTIAAIAVDGSANAYTTGVATGLVTTPGAFQTDRPGTDSPFVAKLNAAGTAMAYATYLGGNGGGGEKGTAIAVDASGSAYVTGQTFTADFPTENAMQPSRRGERDAFVAKLNPEGSALAYSTYLGGTERETGNGIAVDASGQAFVVGHTYSDNFPVTPGAFQTRKGSEGSFYANGFVAKLRADGSDWSTHRFSADPASTVPKVPMGTAPNPSP